MLVRLCQGVYMKPGSHALDIIHIAKEIARRSGSTTVLKSDEYKGATRIITLYTNGATRSMILQDRTVIKFSHEIKIVNSIELRNYVNDFVKKILELNNSTIF